MTIKCDMILLISSLGDKWTYPVLRLIKVKKRATFNQINDEYLEKINPRSLSKTLKNLIKFKIVNRKNEKGRVVYTLSKEGNKIERWLSALSTYLIENELAMPRDCEKMCFNCPEGNFYKKEKKIVIVEK